LHTLFSFTWHPYAVDPDVDYSNEPVTLVEFRLEPKDKGTVLYLTESGFDALPKDRRFEAFRMNEDGWTEQMANIENHLNHKP
jgi:Activator of Hsp90 ATPase homolog 1-like protein